MELTILSFWAAIILVISAMLYVLPQLSRCDIFFSVTVSPEFRNTPEARRILAGYRRGIIVATLITMVVVTRSGIDLTGLVVLMLEQVAALGLFVRAHRQALAYQKAASGAREASLQPQPRMAGLGLLLLGPYVMLACAALMLRAHWNEIPDPMPVHWDLVGNPNGWVPKAPLMFWGVIGADFAGCAIFTFVMLAMMYSSRQIAVSGSPAREERRFRWIGIAIVIAGSYLTASLAFLPLNPHAAIGFGGVGFLLAIVIVGSLELMRRGQGGARLAPARSAEVISDRTPDACWKWGLLYYNPDDPALMVEKRFGIGWTLNFAHRGAWIFMALTLAVLFFSLGMPLLARYR